MMKLRRLNCKFRTTIATQDFIRDFVAAVPKSRNAHLARLDMVHWGFKSGSSNAEDLIAACKQYYDLNKHKLYCFGDLRTYVSSLDQASMTSLVNYTSKGQNEGTDVSCLESRAELVD